MFYSNGINWNENNDPVMMSHDGNFKTCSIFRLRYLFAHSNVATEKVSHESKHFTFNNICPSNIFIHIRNGIHIDRTNYHKQSINKYRKSNGTSLFTKTEMSGNCIFRSFVWQLEIALKIWPKTIALVEWNGANVSKTNWELFRLCRLLQCHLHKSIWTVNKKFNQRFGAKRTHSTPIRNTHRMPIELWQKYLSCNHTLQQDKLAAYWKSPNFSSSERKHIHTIENLVQTNFANEPKNEWRLLVCSCCCCCWFYFEHTENFFFVTTIATLYTICYWFDFYYFCFSITGSL